MKNFYNRPTQVMFLNLDDVVDTYKNFENKHAIYLGGIAIGNEIICGCCGAMFKIEDIKQEYDELIRQERFSWLGKFKPIHALTWINISEEILGGQEQPDEDDYEVE